MKNFHLVMGFVFGLVIGIIDLGIGLSWIEMGVIGAGSFMICLVHYNLVSKDLIEQKEVTK